MNFTENPVHSKPRERRLPAGAMVRYLDICALVQQAGSGQVPGSCELSCTAHAPRIAGPQ
jgi:hypothetical protein